MIRIIFALLLCFASRSFGVSAVATAGFGVAGQNLSEITGHQNYEIRAGSGAGFYVGLIVPVTPTRPHRFELQSNLGWIGRGDSRQGDQNKIMWDRFPLEILYYYRNSQADFRIGYGVTYHIFNHLKGSGTTSGASDNFDNALGWTVAFDKLLCTKSQTDGCFAAGLKYTGVTYHSPKFSADANGDALFVTLSLIWL